ncbi:hypothetical protein [Burkholderia cepacia]|uniref:hypothetical protein n=1 Tax=Burkholderia cepacia TaxID=292 RepID=UPI003EE0EF50
MADSQVRVTERHRTLPVSSSVRAQRHSPRSISEARIADSNRPISTRGVTNPDRYCLPTSRRRSLANGYRTVRIRKRLIAKRNRIACRDAVPSSTAHRNVVAARDVLTGLEAQCDIVRTNYVGTSRTTTGEVVVATGDVRAAAVTERNIVAARNVISRRRTYGSVVTRRSGRAADGVARPSAQGSVALPEDVVASIKTISGVDRAGYILTRSRTNRRIA